MSRAVAARLTKPGPKRILALDGGGVRGAVTIGFLEEIEALLRKRYGRSDYVLSDYFDLIGGTSVGSILATMLALGWPISKVREEFWRFCPEIFRRDWNIGQGIFFERFHPRNLEKSLERVLQGRKLESDDFKTGLAIIAKRVDTGSAWVMYNNPYSKYWNTQVDATSGEQIGNRYYSVADIIRASTAAPTYFKPHTISTHEGADSKAIKGLFVDGGLSPYNNPAFLLFMMAGISGYRLGGVKNPPPLSEARHLLGIPWTLGADNLFIVSVGTGDFRMQVQKTWSDFAARFGGKALSSMIADNQMTTLKAMQWLSNPTQPWTINTEVGDLHHDDLGRQLGSSHSLCTFERFDIRLEGPWLRETHGAAHLTNKRVKKLQRIDDPLAMHTYITLAREAAAKQVVTHKFPSHFDPI